MADTNDDIDDVTQSTAQVGDNAQDVQGDDTQNNDSTAQDDDGNNDDTSDDSGNISGDDDSSGNTDNAQDEPQDNTDTSSNPPPVAVCLMCIHMGDISGKIATGAQREMTIGEALRMLPKHPTNFKTLANARMLAENMKPALPTQVCLHTGNMDIDPMTGNAICRPCTVFNCYGECALFETAEEKDVASEPSDDTDTSSDTTDTPSGGDDTSGGDITSGDSGGTSGGDVTGGDDASGGDAGGNVPSGDDSGNNTGDAPITGDDADSGNSNGTDDGNNNDVITDN